MHDAQTHLLEVDERLGVVAPIGRLGERAHVALAHSGDPIDLLETIVAKR